MPLTLILRKGLVRDGSNPALLEMRTCLQIKDGTAYPAVSRLADICAFLPWQFGRLAATP